MPNENVQYEFQDEGNSGKHKKSFVVWIVIASIAVILALLVGLYFFMDSTQYKGGTGELGQLDGKTAEEIQEALDNYVEEGMLNISIASQIEFENGTAPGTAFIENVPSNKYVLKVTITTDSNGEVVYQSGGIKPDSTIETITLSQPLAAGVYPATATFSAYDPDTLQEVGQAAAKVTLVVKN